MPETSDTRRTVKSISHPRRQTHGPLLTTTDLGERELGEALDPFIVISLYDMSGPTFPPHPHAGFSVATYILPESPVGFINQDTLGNRNRIAPGALHLTVAGRGVQHEEQPERDGSLARGFQIWIDHADPGREMAPLALHLRAGDVPVVSRDGATIRAVLGASNGIASPLTPPTPVRVIDVALERSAQFSQDLSATENAFIVVLAGVAEISGARVANDAVAVTSTDRSTLVVRADDEPVRFTLFAGRPLRQKRGPFVATDASQLQRFMTNFQDGGFGALKPFAAQPDWRPNDGQELDR